MCIHQWARKLGNDGHMIYVCTECSQKVDFTAAREEFERQQRAVNYDPTAGMVETPAGPGRFVEFDGCRQTVIVELEGQHFLELDAGKCFLPAHA